MPVRQTYGWVPDKHDINDRIFVPKMARRDLPPVFDLRAQMPPVYDQGALGSCTGNAIGAAIQFARMKQNRTGAAVDVPSRLFIYYEERAREGTIPVDAGAMIRDGIKVVQKKGTCFEGDDADDWAYNTKLFAERPPGMCYATAKKNQVLSYERLDNAWPLDPDKLKGCLADGFPVVFGFTVYDTFESSVVTNTGVVPMPKRGDKAVGGHAVLAVGYDDATKMFTVRNSWGFDWGADGNFFMPYDYVCGEDAQDFWTIRLTE